MKSKPRPTLKERAQKLLRTRRIRLPGRTYQEVVDALQSNGYAAVESQSRPGTFYHVNGSCGCRSFGIDGNCKHRRALEIRLGELYETDKDFPEVDWSDWRSPEQKKAARAQERARGFTGVTDREIAEEHEAREQMESILDN